MFGMNKLVPGEYLIIHEFRDDVKMWADDRVCYVYEQH